MKLKKDEQLTDNLDDILKKKKADDLRNVISGGKAKAEDKKTVVKKRGRQGRPPRSEPAKPCTFLLSLDVIQMMEDNQISNKSKFINWLVSEYFKKGPKAPWF
jgi:hypothetical protein